MSIKSVIAVVAAVGAGTSALFAFPFLVEAMARLSKAGIFKRLDVMTRSSVDVIPSKLSMDGGVLL